MLAKSRHLPASTINGSLVNRPADRFSRAIMPLLRRVCFALLAVSLARAEVVLAPLFTDHAVLQRDKPVNLWGWATPGEQVPPE